MATTIKLSDDLIAKARHYGKIYSRSAPKQIEFWAKIGRIAEENPKLSYGEMMDKLIENKDAKEGN